jgi:hypothetical protein
MPVSRLKEKASIGAIIDKTTSPSVPVYPIIAVYVNTPIAHKRKFPVVGKASAKKRLIDVISSDASREENDSVKVCYFILRKANNNSDSITADKRVAIAAPFKPIAGSPKWPKISTQLNSTLSAMPIPLKNVAVEA